MAVAEDPGAQRRGIVNVSYAVGSPYFKSIQGGLRKSIPLHIACQHFVYDDPSAYQSASIGIYLLTKNHRVRFRSHMGKFNDLCSSIPSTIVCFRRRFILRHHHVLDNDTGTHIECQYALTTYGIPRNALPVNTNGDLSNVFHMAWLQKRREMEEIQPIPYSPRTTVCASPVLSADPSQTLVSHPVLLQPSLGLSAPPEGNCIQIRDPRPSDILVSLLYSVSSSHFCSCKSMESLFLLNSS
jgi:hypothetical protein